MTPYQFGQFVKMSLHKTAAPTYYPNAGRNEFDDDLDEEIAEVKRMGNSVPQSPLPSRVPGVAQTGGRMVNGTPAPVAPNRTNMPQPGLAGQKPLTTPTPRPAAVKPPAPRQLPTLPSGPGSSRDLGGSFE